MPAMGRSISDSPPSSKPQNTLYLYIHSSMKPFLIALLLVLGLQTQAQLFSRLNISLLSLTDPDTSSSKSPVGNRYSGCWGWFQAAKNKEYAISGGKDGTYFIDVTNPVNPVVCDFVEGKKGCTWREMKTYQHYCYIISDDDIPNKFQIVDLQYLPDSVHVIHSGTSYFERGHTIWIDNNRMYIGMTTFQTGSSPMSIWSLATPTAPVLLKRLESDVPSTVINQVHDMFVRNDTIYASAGWQGLFVFKFDAQNDTLIPLGGYNGYNGSGYNHSSSLTNNGKYLVFCDEVPESLPMHVIDVQNLGNMQPLSTFHPAPNTTPHNPYVIGNNFAVVSCYQDGLYIFDISNPSNVLLAGYFDTYPQGGVNTGVYPNGAYAGNWGAYPYLPSGKIVANDMQNGVFMLDATKAYTTNVKSQVPLVGISSTTTEEFRVVVYPNPASTFLSIHLNQGAVSEIDVLSMLGEQVYHQSTNESQLTLDVRNWSSGTYFLKVTNANGTYNRKLIVTH